MAVVKRIGLAFVMSGIAACAGAQQEEALPKPEAPPPKAAKQAAPPRVPMRNFEDMLAKARQDLSMRLGGTEAQITLAGWAPVQLPARVLHCEVPKGDEGEPAVPGYRIVLVYKAREYTYLSDTKTVTACPRIEAS
jgi:hypothetical protein